MRWHSRAPRCSWVAHLGVLGHANTHGAAAGCCSVRRSNQQRKVDLEYCSAAHSVRFIVVAVVILFPCLPSLIIRITSIVQTWENRENGNGNGSENWKAMGTGMGMGDDWEMGHGNLWARMGSAYQVLSREEERKKTRVWHSITLFFCDIRSQTQPRCFVCQRRHSQHFPIVHPIPSHLIPISVPSTTQCFQLPDPRIPRRFVGMGKGMAMGEIGDHLGKTGKFRTARKRKVKKTCLCHYLTHIFLCDGGSRTPPLFVSNLNSISQTHPKFGPKPNIARKEKTT